MMISDHSREKRMPGIGMKWNADNADNLIDFVLRVRIAKQFVLTLRIPWQCIAFFTQRQGDKERQVTR